VGEQTKAEWDGVAQLKATRKSEEIEKKALQVGEPLCDQSKKGGSWSAREKGL